jgi:GWxTD domain-containing protein
MLRRMPRAFAIFTLALAVCPWSRGHAEVFPGEDSLMQYLNGPDLATYYELRLLLNPYQMRQYLTLPTPRARAKWVERFWLELDPTPTTDANERRLEYEQRLDAARRLFPCHKAPGWDDRGDFMVRYGPPDAETKILGEVTYAEGLIPPKIVWRYSRPPMTITFEDTDLIGIYHYMPEPSHFGVRSPGPGIPDDIDYTIDTGPASGVATEPWPFELPASGTKLLDYLEKTPVIFSCDLDTKRIPLYFDVACFKGRGPSVRAEINFEVPAAGIRFVPKDGKRAGEVEFRVVVRNSDMEKVASAHSVMTPVTADSIPGSILLPEQVIMELRPGYYHLGLEAYDRNSRRRGMSRTTLEIAPFDASPALSDIEFASSFAEAFENPRFVKGNLRVVPHALRAYRKPLPIAFYFEIYGLDTDDRGIAFYRIEYRIDPLEKKRWGPVLQDASTNISSTFETSGYGSTQPERLSIATQNLWKGSFNLVVTVTDRRTGRAATKSAKFRILE